MILALGSHGDVHPLIALGKGLQQSGHDVYIGAPLALEPLVRELGLHFSLIRLDMQEVFQSAAGRAGLESGGNLLSLIKNFNEALEDKIPVAGVDCWQICQEMDLLIHSNVGFTFFASSLAEKINIIDIAIFLHPIHPTKVFPSFLFPMQRNLGGTFNKLTYYIADLMHGIPHRVGINRWRKECLGLPPIGVGYFKQARQRTKLMIYCFSPHVIPKPTDWGEDIVITDYLTLNHTMDWQPPSDLVDFIEAGEPPIYAGFGSMMTSNPKEATEIVIESLARTQKRGIIVSGWGELSGFNELPDNIFKLDFAPFDWLFPKMSAIIHHGGAGTTGTALRAGVPSIAVPFFFDQPFWGQRVASLGAGAPPIPRKKLSVERLSAAIKMVTTDKQMQQRAAQLGQLMRAEKDGVVKTVEVINDYLAKR